MINIRKAKKSDCSFLVVLTQQLGYEVNEEQISERLEVLFNNGKDIIVAEMDNIIVGYISFEPYYTIYMEPGVTISALVVDQNYRHNGIGKELVKYVESYARNNNLKYLRLYSSSYREEAHKFYRNIGFTSEKESKRFIKEL